MVNLSLKSFPVGEQQIKYSDLLKQCLNFGGKDGLNAEEMRKRIKVLDKLETATDTLELEDAEAQTLKETVAVMPWSIVDKGLLEMLDAVKAL